jgi:hypothetical protein
LYFSEARSGSGVSQAKLNHRFALTAHRQPVSPFLSLGGGVGLRIIDRLGVLMTVRNSRYLFEPLNRFQQGAANRYLTGSLGAAERRIGLRASGSSADFY